MPQLILPSVPSDEEIAEKLISCAGLSPRDPDPTRADVAVSILLPNDDPAWAKQYLTTKTETGYVSNCALFAQYFYQFKILGMLTAADQGPYRPHVSRIFTDLIQNAQAYSAYVTSKADLSIPPSCGDIYMIGSGRSTHASCVVGFDPDTGIARCVDGGQVDNTWIAERERPWKTSSLETTLGSRHVFGAQRIKLLRDASNAALNR